MDRIEFHPLAPSFGAECLGVDLGADLERHAHTLREAWRSRGLLLLRNQDLDSEQNRKVAVAFGTLFGADSAPAGHVVAQYISTTEPGFVSGGPLAFHTDHTFLARPAAALMLYAVDVPPPSVGGATVFVSTKTALQTLDPVLRDRIDGLRVRHGEPDWSKWEAAPGLIENGPSFDHPLVYPHPTTGDELLFLSHRHVDRIVGVTSEESASLVEELAAHVANVTDRYRHVWRRGDLIIWDNVLLQHAREEFDASAHRRHLRRHEIGRIHADVVHGPEVPARAGS